jgi:hypothetical protein
MDLDQLIRYFPPMTMETGGAEGSAESSGSIDSESPLAGNHIAASRRTSGARVEAQGECYQQMRNGST